MLTMTPEQIGQIVAQDLQSAHMAEVVIDFTEEWTILNINSADDAPVVWFFSDGASLRSHAKVSTLYPPMSSRGNAGRQLEALIEQYAPTLKNEQDAGMPNYLNPEVRTFR